MKKVLYILYQPYKWLIFAPVLLLSTLLLGITALVLLMFLGPRTVSRVCGQTWARINSFVTPMLVTVEGRENIDPEQSYVVISNHQSQFDIFVLYGWLGIDFRWVMKQELRKVPALGVACEKIGHIFIDRSNHEKALASINRAKQQITGGTSVLFFPEGTRSCSTEMLPFKKGAFRMAVDMGLPLLPVTIVGTEKILPNKTIDLFPGSATMIVHPPIDTTGYDDGTLRELMDRAREVIESARPPRNQ
ncbi:MAG: 1-acyl-sn-glycerol-3-phosphate acyltransferase [Syntrophales bacterium]|jgi:1-acyl-sn-glycerol-3-phosphate acyltransferase|nr:1-acyl-sn-glycerol-3-phosphate acyltransferase [Syntrophales bacterium]MCK9527045.1 1-acyl-sn-glycerol-3-phosphate acyltransferase [Syntrophales bacterium]MDX9921830.1 lysophospholipid acyltransferase family protein [Syntrophales bacterium]